MVAKQNLTVYQGSDLRKVLEFKDESSVLMDLTGYSFRGQAKPNYTVATPSFEFTFTLRDQVSSTGLVDVHLPASQTENLAITKETNYIYDFELITPAGDVKRFMEGIVKVYPEVTK